MTCSHGLTYRLDSKLTKGFESVENRMPDPNAEGAQVVYRHRSFI